MYPALLKSRPFRYLGLLSASLTLSCPVSQAEPISPPIQELHNEVWNRFVLKPQHLLLDYTNLDGTVEIPTAEECLMGKPNALSWWTPIENGPFFGGLYIDGILRRWKLTGSDEDREKARALMEGLMLCASVGNAPGFVARAVLEDKTSHYAIGSDDQTGPWIYGLWRYVKSGAATEEEKKRIVAKLTEVASALQANRWLMPCDPIGDMKPDQVRGGWSGADYRGASRMLFTTRALYDLTGDSKWKQAYEEALEEKFPNGQSRLAIVADGMPGEWNIHPALAKSHLYIYIVSQAMISDLAEMETDPERRKAYLASLKATAEAALPSVTDKLHPQFGTAQFRTDWRVMNELWQPQTTPDQAASLALAQLDSWQNTGRHAEIEALREPLSALWIAALHPEGRPAETRLLNELIAKVDWKKVHSSFAFLGESVGYLLQDQGNRGVLTAANLAKPTAPREAPAEVAATKSILKEGAKRCSDLFPLLEFPADLEGAALYTIPRRDGTQPGPSYQVKVDSGNTAWLLVMDKGEPIIPEGWEETDLTTRWNAGSNPFRDRIFQKSVRPGETISVPASAAQSDGTFAIPHALVVGNAR